MASRGDRGAVPGGGGNTDEHRLEPERAKPEPDLIILGHAVGRERASAMTRGEPRQRAPLDRACHPGKRDRRPDGLANDQLLAMAFGEFVAIMARDPRARRIGQRHDGQLDCRCPPDQRGEQAKLAGMDHILGVMKHDRARRATPPFLGDQGDIKCVEAVGFGRRTGMRHRHCDNTRIGDARNRQRGRRIIGIVADEQPVIARPEANQRLAQHRRDDRALVPGRNEYCHPPRPRRRI